MLSQRLRGARTLVTGGSSETGPFICRAFAEAGADVATTWHANESGGLATVEAIRSAGVQGHLTHFDILDQASVDGLVATLQATWDHLDVAILNCGSKGLRPFEALTRAQLDIAIDGNLKGNFMLAKALGYWMKRSGGLGKIILISAMSADNATHSAYGLGKAAQDAAAGFLAYHLAPEVTVNTISPITIDQDPAREAAPPDPAPLGRKVHAREIARLCTLLCDPAFDTVTGEIIRMDSGRHVATAFPRPT